MKKIIGILLLMTCLLALVTGCTGKTNNNQQTEGQPSESNTGNNQISFNGSKEITVVSREDGSGTRGAFIELFGIEFKGDNGIKKDMTTKEAIISNKTDIMMTNIARNEYGVGYISLGSLNDTIKAVQVEGIIANADNIKNGTYPIARPFNIAIKGEPTGITKDFINFILSADGQEVVSKSYIAINDNAPAYIADKLSGKIVVAGSSSVTPIMEKLKEAYIAINPNIKIEIQQSDSSAGMIGAIDGNCDIGMASRNLNEDELAELTEIPIALDGIVVIVNKANPVTNLTKKQVKDIFMGETIKWSEVIE